MKNKILVSLLIGLTCIGVRAGNANMASSDSMDNPESDYESAEGDSEYSNYQEPVEANTVLPDNARNPGNQYVHVDMVPLSVEVGIPGFWRLRVRPGYTWVDGFYDHDYYIPGHWRPAHERNVNSEWVPGHWSGQGWIPGRWRASVREGYTWVEGHWNLSGEWVEGYWNPVAAPESGTVWEPGYWGPQGWVEGYWRPFYRDGYIWISGEWGLNGNWVCGRWEHGQRNAAWAHAYWDRQGRHHPGRIIRLANHPQIHTQPGPGYSRGRSQWDKPRQSPEKAYNRQVPIKNEDKQIQNYRQDREGQGGQVRKLGESDQEKNYQQNR